MPPHAPIPARPLLSDHARGLLAAAIVVACWSGFNIVSRFGSKGVFTPFDLAALRFGVSGLLAAPLFLYAVRPREWPRYLALALFGGLGYALLVYGGFAFAPTAHAGVFVNGGIPFWTVVITAVLTGFQVSRHIVVSLLLSTAGLLLIGYESLFAVHGRDEWLGDLLFLTAALSWAIFGLLVRRWQIRPPLAISGIACFSALAYLPLYATVLPGSLAGAPWGDIALQAVYQGIIAALVAAGLYSYATQKIGVCQASMMLALVPGLSAIGAYFILDEHLSTAAILGIAVVSLGALRAALPGNRAVVADRPTASRTPA